MFKTGVTFLIVQPKLSSVTGRGREAGEGVCCPEKVNQSVILWKKGVGGAFGHTSLNSLTF